MKRNLLLFLLLLAVVSGSSRAQSTATLAGVVTDPTGAVLPGATVTIQNTGTGVSRTIQSDSAGVYVVSSLPPGDYSVSVVASGFGNYTVKQLTLQVDQKAALNVKMSLASAGETVQVEAAAPLIDAETITVGQVIDRRTVQEIPLNGRHFLDLTTLTAGGVTAHPPREASPRPAAASAPTPSSPPVTGRTPSTSRSTAST